MALEDIRRERIRKLERYEAGGRDAYPASIRPSLAIGGVLKRFTALWRAKRALAVAGRIRALRAHGGAAFVDLEDGSGRIQLYLERSSLGGSYGEALTALDIGDFIAVSGTPLQTRRGEPTIRVSAWRLIAKSLRPLPDKWHGLKDVEERFRRRYLDLLMNPEVRRRFELRSAIIRMMRTFLDGRDFHEVETPLLQAIPGGALARPFKTHHNALGVDLYLRVAPELYLKRLIVGGYERVYELAKVFRNEGVDATHNPEYTLLEFYAAYWDEEAMMGCVEELFRVIARKHGAKQYTAKRKFPRLPFRELLKRYALVIDYDGETSENLRLRAQQFGIAIAPNTPREKIADDIFEKVCRPHLVQPTFVTEFPLGISPLAKAKDASCARRFNLIVGGQEVADGWAEVNDPRDQERRFREQERVRAGGDEEAHRFDQDFIEALEYGMPPLAGVGIGIDRLVMLLTDTKNIREVVLFPTLRPK